MFVFVCLKNSFVLFFVDKSIIQVLKSTKDQKKNVDVSSEILTNTHFTKKCNKNIDILNISNHKISKDRGNDL